MPHLLSRSTNHNMCSMFLVTTICTLCSQLLIASNDCSCAYQSTLSLSLNTTAYSLGPPPPTVWDLHSLGSPPPMPNCHAVNECRVSFITRTWHVCSSILPADLFQVLTSAYVEASTKRTPITCDIIEGCSHVIKRWTPMTCSHFVKRLQSLPR